MAPPLRLTDYCPLHESLLRLSDEEAWVLRLRARTRGKSRDNRIFDVAPLKKQISVKRALGDPVPHLRALRDKGFLDLTKKRARTTDQGNTLKHALFDSLGEREPWRQRVERYRMELGRQYPIRRQDRR